MNSETSAIDALRRAVETLYRTFARYPLRPDLAGCEHCIPVSDSEQLCSKPLRELTEEILNRYVGSAINIWGDVEDFKHFLPRLLELTFGDFEKVDSYMLVLKLQDADWPNWPEYEKIAVEAYLLTQWQVVLACDPACSNAEAWFHRIGQFIDDLAPFLDIWRRHSSVSALRHLAQFVHEHFDRLIQKGTLKLWTKERSAQTNQVMNWLFDPCTREALEQAAIKYASEPFGHEFSLAVDLLRSIRAGRK